MSETFFLHLAKFLKICSRRMYQCPVGNGKITTVLNGTKEIYIPTFIFKEKWLNSNTHRKSIIDSTDVDTFSRLRLSRNTLIEFFSDVVYIERDSSTLDLHMLLYWKPPWYSCNVQPFIKYMIYVLNSSQR